MRSVNRESDTYERSIISSRQSTVGSLFLPEKEKKIFEEAYFRVPPVPVLKEFYLSACAHFYRFHRDTTLIVELIKRVRAQ